MDDALKQQVIDLIQQQMSGLDQGGLTNNALYSHHHTGYDFPKVNGSDLNVIAGVGVPFPVSDASLPQTQPGYAYSMLTEGSTFVIEPNLSFNNNAVPASLIFGNDPFQYFNTVLFNILGPTSTTPNWSVIATDSTTSIASSLTVSPDIIEGQVDAGLAGGATSVLSFDMQAWTTTGEFTLQLPATIGLPTPVPGMITFDGSDFRGVDSSGTWKTFTLT